MQTLEFARQRVRGILAEIERLKECDFPYGHSLDALERIQAVFSLREKRLEKLTAANNVDVVQTACEESLVQIFRYLPLLGFILRSTDVRNSFEIFGPLVRMMRKVLGPNTKLIVSSEWNFSPHVYSPYPDLPEFVILGLPASESGNPLLVPLAGHELGHTTWGARKLTQAYKPRINAEIGRLVQAREARYQELFGGQLSDALFVAQNLAPAYNWAMRQAEESFCDFLGVRLFAESFLFAFAYLAAPKVGQRHEFYPGMTDRISGLARSSIAYDVVLPDGYTDWFVDELNPPRSEKERFLLELADEARRVLIEDLIRDAQEIADAAHMPQRTEEKIAAVTKALALLTPAASIGDMTNILNAAWRISANKDMWTGLVDDHSEALNELVLKSIEILEFEDRVR